jgi:hypothetical protein
MTAQPGGGMSPRPYPISRPWEARDDDGVQACLERVADDRWQLSMEEGPFSGYPTINLTRQDLCHLAVALDIQLNRSADGP